MTDVKGRKYSTGVIFAVAYIAYSAIYIARLNFSVASALFEAQGTLSKAQIGVIGSIFSLVYAVSKVPNGYMGDRLRSRLVIVIGLVITGVSNLLIGFMPRFWSIAIFWGLNAYGQSMLWGPMLRTFSENYSGDTFRRLIQYLVSAVAAGGIAGILIASKCATALGASACFFVPGIIALVMALATRILFPDCSGRETEHDSIIASTARLFGKSEFRRIIFPAMAHGMIKDNINVWLAIYFIDTFHTDISSAAGFIFLIPACALAGRFLFPIFYRVLKNDFRVSMTAFFMCVIVNLLLFSGKLSIAGAVICMGADSALVSVINSHVLSQFPASICDKGELSFTASVMDLVTYGGAGIGSLIFGVLIGKFGYESMFMIWSVISLISAFIMRSFIARKNTAA